jgi:hypothetical protein
MKQQMLVIFAVVVSVFAVLLIADVVLAGDIFLPLITKGETNTTVGPSGALYVFTSSGTTTGNAGGRPGMNAICSATDPASHFCTLQEIDNAFRDTGVFFASAFSQAWLDNNGSHMRGTPWGNSYTDYEMIIEWGAGCNTWTDNQSTSLGRAITSTGAGTTNAWCSTSSPVACCKWIP